MGQKPSRASYFLNDPAEAMELLLQLAGGEAGGTPRALAHQGGLELGIARASIPE